MWAIISGTGLENITGFNYKQALDTNTPFGQTSSGLKRAMLNTIEIIFLPRHGTQHELLPSEINYRANIFALKREGVTKILSFSAVGSLRENLDVGNIVIPTQYINQTSGVRKHTFCGDGIVSHLSLANPICLELAAKLLTLKDNFNFPIHADKTYVCIEGPHYSTRAESNKYRILGGDVIGMTNFPEYSLAREAGICYLPCTFVTDYDCWRHDIAPVTYRKVGRASEEFNDKALKISKLLISLAENNFPSGCPESGLANNLLYQSKTLTAEHRAWLEIILTHHKN